MIIRVVDKLMILFFVINVLSSRLVIFGLPIIKAIFVMALWLYFIYFLIEKSRINKKFIYFVLLSFVFILTLSLIGSIKGNLFVHIRGFIFPLFIFLLIPIFIALIEFYGIDRYLRSLLFSITFLALIIIAIYIFSHDNRSVAFLINTYSNNFQVTYPPFGIRVLARTGAFLPCVLLLAYYFFLKEGKKRYWLIFFLISFALYFNHTFGVLFSAIVVMFLSVLMFSKAKMFTSAVVLCLAIGIIAIYMSHTYDYKKQSFDIKEQQTIKALGLFAEKPILGRGLGYVYSNMDSRGTEDVNLEVTYIMILTSTGLIGALFYTFIYMYYLIVCFSIKHIRKASIIIALSHLSILIAGAGNPYILSGGMGFFFITILAATMEGKDNYILHANRLRYAKGIK